jgi:hypothetical protein
MRRLVRWAWEAAQAAFVVAALAYMVLAFSMP